MNNEEKINFLKENYDVIAKKMTHYDAAFRILENLVNNKVEHIDKLEQIENFSIKDHQINAANKDIDYIQNYIFIPRKNK